MGDRRTSTPGDVPGQFDRRTVLAWIMTAAVVDGTAPAHAPAPIVETTLGRVRGLVSDGVRQFRGLPYAASTAGANRFLPPQPALPWAGILEAVAFGHSAPQFVLKSAERAAFAEIEATSEDCLTLNVYTPSTDRSARRPVMVWLHGGGWRFGAGSSPGTRGISLAKLGDVVLVTINHRLDLLGFLKIDDGDPRFADAGNLGVLDMVAALRWVRNNAAAFGGDPGNVTIFGQSGGGSKVAALMATPAARGLFHKAIAQSCSGCLRHTGMTEADALAKRVSDKLGIARLSGEALQRVPLDQLLAASGGRHRPILDGRTFVRHPFDPDAAPEAAGIPLLIGNVATETRIQLAAASIDNFRLDEAEVGRRLHRFLQIDAARIGRILNAYHAAYPADSPGDLLGHVGTDYNYVRNTRRMADLQAAHAPVYSYLFTRRTPALGGILRSPHESEVPFIFGTSEAAAAMVGAGDDIGPLTRLMIATWSSFARTGDPSNRTIPQWPRHRPGARSSMLLDVCSRFGDIPEATALSSLDGLPFFEYHMDTSYVRA